MHLQMPGMMSQHHRQTGGERGKMGCEKIDSYFICKTSTLTCSKSTDMCLTLVICCVGGETLLRLKNNKDRGRQNQFLKPFFFPEILD